MKFAELDVQLSKMAIIKLTNIKNHNQRIENRMIQTLYFTSL